jgi:hypothetical protein
MQCFIEAKTQVIVVKPTLQQNHHTSTQGIAPTTLGHWLFGGEKFSV